MNSKSYFSFLYFFSASLTLEKKREVNPSFYKSSGVAPECPNESNNHAIYGGSIPSSYCKN
jgi:hypothetical protein